MSKDAFWFPHDSNAKDDPKCVLVIEQLGLEGYGIFWVLVETLRDQPGYQYPVKLIPAIARRYNTSTEKVKAIIYNYELFTITPDEFFLSDSLFRRMQPMEDKRLKASLAGKASAEKRKLLSNDSSTVAEHPLNGRSTKRKEKKTVEKNTKEKNTVEESISPSGDAGASAPAIETTVDYSTVEKSKKGIFDFIKNTKPQDIQPYVDFWNIFAKERKFPQVSKLNDHRKRKFAIRIKDSAFDFLEILRKAGKSEFIASGNWFGFDWLIENDSNYLKVLEGKYDPRETEPGARTIVESKFASPLLGETDQIENLKHEILQGGHLEAIRRFPQGTGVGQMAAQILIEKKSGIIG